MRELSQLACSASLIRLSLSKDFLVLHECNILAAVEEACSWYWRNGNRDVEAM